MRQAGSMENELAALSNELAGAVEQAGRTVVAVNARPRFTSSGVLWRPGVIVTAEHTIRRREEIGITLPDGRTTSATLAGRRAGSVLAAPKPAARDTRRPADLSSSPPSTPSAGARKSGSRCRTAAPLPPRWRAAMRAPILPC